FLCAVGKRVVTPHSKVVYSFEDTSNLPSFSLWRKVGHAQFAMAGCTVNQAEVTIAGNEIASIAWSGEFMKWSLAGSVLLTANVIPGASSMTVADATRFFNVGGRVKIGDDYDQVGANNGYEIRAINYVTNVLCARSICYR
ncbi:unnamed protein product, partial [marine sediment metagenome]